MDLGFNEMNGEAALGIATALANKPTMKRLELNGIYYLLFETLLNTCSPVQYHLHLTSIINYDR